MAITCTLGFDAQRILYATIYKKMTSLKSGEVFDIMDYMQTVFDKFSEKQNKDVAAQFVQQMPYFAGVLQFRLPDVDVKLPEGTSLLELSRKFRDVDTGIPMIMSMFSKEKSIKDMVDIANEIAISASKTQLGLSDEESEDVRLKARDPFSGTSEQFKEQDPNKKGPEVKDPSKKTIYNTIKAIRASFPSATSFDTINYQGKNLKLKTIILNRIPSQYQTEYTKALIAQNNAMRAKGISLENVTPVNEQIAIVIVDDKGKFVFFDEQGNVAEEGTLVYQMVRDVRIEKGRYRVTDIYGIEDQILDPTNEAVARLAEMGITIDEFEANGNSFEEYVKEVDEEQQESFKQLMNFRKDIVENDKSYELPINGFSKGVINTAEAGEQKITLANLDGFYPDFSDNNFKSIKTLDTAVNGFKKGDSIIRLGDAYYKVDRAQMPEDLATKIADVLTNPKLSAQQKFDFYIQFTNNEVSDNVRRFMFTYEKNKFKFFVQPYAKDEAKALKKQKENTFVEVNLKSPGAKQTIIDALRESYYLVKDQEHLPTRVIYNKDNVDSGVYISGYDENNKAVISNYFDFIKSLNPEVFTGKTQKTRERFNPYIKFRLPSEFTDQIAKAEREIEETPTTKNIKLFSTDKIVWAHPALGKTTFRNTNPNLVLDFDTDFKPEVARRLGLPESKSSSIALNEWRNQSSENEEKFKNVMRSVWQEAVAESRETGKMLLVSDMMFLRENAADFDKVITTDKETFTKRASKRGDDISKLESWKSNIDKAITGIDQSKVVSTNKYFSELVAFEEDQIEEEEEVEVINEVTLEDLDNEFTGQNTVSPEDFNFDLDRKVGLPADVTDEEIQAAKDWWESSPLKKYIEIGHMTALVNSNVYAKFIVSGSELLIGEEPLGEGKLARIFVNKAKGGTFVDVYHEAWHAFSQLYLTKEQKRKLYKEYRERFPNLANLRSIEIEERIAEEFREYAKNPKAVKDAPVRNTLFRRILNFLKALFGKISRQDIINTTQGETSYQDELFQKLYFSTKNKNFIADFTPLVDNVRFNDLDRGIAQVGNKKEDALSRQDSLLVSNTIDSILSKIIDDTYKKQKSLDKANKSGVLRILSEPENKLKAYNIVKQRLQAKADEFRTQAGLPITKEQTKFDKIKSRQELRDNAVAIIKSRKGDDKFVFLRSQIDNFDNLNLDSKQGERLKGELYKGRIEIIADFFNHKFIKSKDGDKADIIVVDTIEQAQKQFDNYVEGGAKSFTGITFNFVNAAQYAETTPEQSRLLDKIRILETAIANFGDEKRGVVKYHIENSIYDIIRKKFVELEEGEELAMEDPSQKQDYDKNIGGKTLLEFADKEAVYILKSLFKIENGKTVKNELGFEELAPFRTTWNNVVRTIVGTKSPEEQYKKLVLASAIYPELKQLVEYKLPNPNTENTDTEFKITTSFWQTFKKARLPFIQLTVFENPDGSFTSSVTNLTLDANRVIRSFNSKFKKQVKGEFITRQNNITYLNLEKVTQSFINSEGSINSDKYFDFLNAIGLYLTNIEPIRDELTNPVNTNKYGVPYIFNLVKELNKLDKSASKSAAQLTLLDKFKQNPVRVLMSGISKDILNSSEPLRQKNTIDNIVGLETQYGTESATQSIKNPEGNTVNTITEDNELTYIADGLNRATKLSDLWNPEKQDLQYMSYLDPSINPMTEHLQTIKSMFNMTDVLKSKRENRKFEVIMAIGTQLLNKYGGLESGTNTTNLDENSKFLQEFNMFLKGGVQELMRTGSKSSSFGARLLGGYVHPLGKRKNNPYLYVDIDLFVNPNTGDNYAFDNIILPYIAGETKRINIYNTEAEAKNYIGYNNPVEYETVNGKKVTTKTAGGSFSAFEDVLTPGVQEDILKLVNNPEISLLDVLEENPQLKERIREDVRNYFEILTEGMYDFSQEAKYIDPGLLDGISGIVKNRSDQERILVKAYVYNSWIHNFELAHLLVGDVAQFNHWKEELHKRITGPISTGKGFRVDLAAQDAVNRALDEVSYAKSLGKDYDQFRYRGTLNTAIVREVVRPSYYLPEIEKGLRADYEERYKNLDPETKKQLIEERVKKDLEPYREMKEADGAGYITLDAYRTLKKLQNNWSNDQENLYRRIAKGLPVSPADALEFFPVYKLQNYGFISKQEIEGRIVNTVLPVTSMHKFALTPLIPSVFKGTDLESLHQQMMKQNIQYVTYESGSKVGAVTSNGKADVIYDDTEMKRLKPDIKFTKNIIYPQYIKEAASVNSTYKGKSTNSTQFRKLILEGLFMQGMKKTDRLGVAATRYNQAVNSLTGVLKLEMLEELGAVEKNGKYEVDLKQLLKYIRRALESKDIPQHLLNDIGVTPDNRLKSDLSIHLEARAIERTIMSILEKKFVRQKVNGEPLVQVPGTMTNGLWDNMLRFKEYTADQKQIMNEFLGSNTLSFYTMAKDGKTVRGMGVALTLQGEWLKLLNAKHIDGEVIGTRDRLNEMIVNEKWLKENEKAITLTGVRIPVQGYNSMEFARVQYFLDPSAGNMIIPPAEIVAKAGSDFDVDKITAYFPNLSNDGKFIEKTETLEEVKAKVQTKKSDENIKGYLAEVRKSYENELLDSIKSILEMPENYANLVRPNETYILKDIADELEDYILEYNRFNNISVEGYRYQNPKETNPAKRKRRISSTRPLEPRYNLRKHVENLEGKDVLGIVANENSAHPVLTSVGAAMPVSYQAAVWDQGQQKYIEVTDLNREALNVPDNKLINYKTRLKLNHNTVNLADRDGKVKPHISLSDIDTSDFVNRIADMYSHAMNGTVDVEKDPWVFLIQSNLQVAPVLFYLFKAGVPVEEAVYFVSNPMIREYVKQQKRIGATYAPLTGYGLEKGKEAMLKYRAALNTIQSNAKYNIESKLLDKDNKFTTDVVTVVTGTSRKSTVTTYNTADFLEVLDNGKLDIGYLKAVYGSKRTQLEINADTTKDLLFRMPRPTNEFYYDDATIIYENAGVADTDRFKLTDLKKLVRSSDVYDTASDMSFAVFMHFLEIEKYIRGINTLKRNMKVDTKTYKNPEEILKSEITYQEAGNNSKVLDGLSDKIKDETVLSELFDKKILGTILENISPLAHNEVVRDFIQNALKYRLKDITERFGQGADGQSDFIAEFKDAMNDFIYQNFMSNIIDSEGNITTIPDTYRERQVKINRKQSEDVVYGIERSASGVETKVIYINPDIIDKDYYDKRYLTNYKGSDGYESRGLKPMLASSDFFPNTESDRDASKSQYYRFVLEREYAKIANPFETLVKNKNKDLARIKSMLVGGIDVAVRDDSKTREAYKIYINQRALLNSFNRAMIMYTPEFSYTSMLENIINEFPELANTYTVLSQIRAIDVKNTAFNPKIEEEKRQKQEKGEEVRFENEFFNLFTLTDANSITGQDAEIYQQQLKRLASINIQKVENPEDNKRISEIFRLFPLMAVYQHGYGKSMHGVNSILPTADLNAIMEIAKQGFMKNYLNKKSLNLIFDRLVGKNYNNYVVTISDYNTAPAEVRAPEAPQLFINELTDEESFIEAQEVSIVKTDGQFTFQDGTEIAIPFDLNSEQTNALEQLENFFKQYQENINAGTGKSITLTGYAGTGKTTIMSFFNKYLEQKIFSAPIYTSPTNRANAITKLNNPKAKVFTLHKLFGLREDIDLVDGDYDLSEVEFTSDDTNKKIKRGDILVVDESSMMNDTLYDMLERAKQELNLAIIYVGDPGQIRPVGQDHVSRVFTDNDVIPLTKVMRTGDNPILKESTDLRNGADFSFVSAEIGGKGVTYFNTGEEYQRVLTTNLLKMKDISNPLYFRMLFGEGVKDGSISRANDIARKVIFGEESNKLLIPGDLLMGYFNFAENYQTGQPLIINSGDYYVANVKPVKKRIDEANVTIDGYEVTLQNALDPTQFPINVFVADHTKSLNELIKYADRISDITIESLKHKFTNRRLYGQLYAKAKELAKEVAVMVNVMDKNGKLKIHKTLDYGYAHTIHKSQGGTYARTLIMEQKISDTRFDDELKNQLKYVAMSRATDHVYVFTNKPINEAAAKAKPAQPQPDMPTPPAPTTEPTVSTTNNPAEYTNYHGGAKKYDTYWEEEGKSFGITKHTVYDVKSYDALDKATKDELESRYQSARTWLGRGNVAADTYAGKLVRRDMMQAAKADGIFAVSEIVAPGTKGRKGYENKTNHPIIEGGTGYAVASGILLGKPVYVFNQDSSYGYETGWYKWDSSANNFIKTDIPVLTKNYAGVGSSTNETEIGKQAIRDVYTQTFGKPKTIPEIIAEGTSPYRGRFTVKRMFDSTVFIESDVKLIEAIKKALDKTTSPEYKGILKSYLDLLDKNILQRNIFLSRDRYKADSSGTLGISAATEFVGIRREIDGEGKLSERQIQTMVHELTHMLTLQPFIKEDDNVKLTAKETEFLKEIRSLYLYVKSLESSENMDFSNAMSNEFEFIADAIADPKFRAYLNTIKYDKGKSVLSKLIEIIKKLLGVKSGTALETIIDQVYSLREDVNYKHYDTFKHLVDEMRIIERKDELKAVTQPTGEITGIEINSNETGLGNDLTNVHYAKNGKSKYDIAPSDKTLTLTSQAKNTWGESVEAWYKSNNARVKGIPEGAEGDAYDMKLMVGLITDKLTQYPSLVSQITERGGLDFLDKSTHTMGTSRWSSKNPKNMFINALKQAYQNVTATQPTEGREPVRKKGTMYFSYNGLQRPEVLAKTTFDAILAGQRTATTRYPQDFDADYWFDTEPGDIITWWSGAKTGQGKSVTVQVTSVVPVDFTQMSDQELENWSKLEGWSIGYAKSKRIAKTRNKGIQIRFRVLPGDQARTLSGPSTDNLDNSDDFENNCQKPFLD